jgi:HEAT repeat protein
MLDCMRRVLFLCICCSFGLVAAVEDEKPWTILNAGLSHEDSVKRRQALSALGTVNNLLGIRKLEAALEDKDSRVRQTAVATLGQIKSRRSIPKLKKALEDDAPEVSFAAAKVLWEMGDKSGKDVLLDVLVGERSDAPGAIQGAMRGAKETLRSPKRLALMGLKEGAGALLGPLSFGVGAVEELIKEGPAAGRVLSIMLLAKDSDWRSLIIIESALEDKNDFVRAAAAKALAERGNKAAIAKITPLMDDKNPIVSYTAAASVIRLGGAGRAAAAQSPSQTQAAK